MYKFAHVVARNTAFSMAAQVVVKVVSFCFSVFIVRKLGAQEFGQYAAMAAFASLFLFVGDLGLTPYFVREVAKLRDREDGQTLIESLYSTIVVLRLILTSFGVLVMLGVAWLTGRPSVLIVALCLNILGMILYGLQGTSDAVLAGYERFDFVSSAKIIYQVIFVLFGSLALFWGFGYYGLICATLLAVISLTTVCWQAVRRLGIKFGKVRIQLWPSLLRSSLPFGVVAFALGVSYKFDSVLLNVFRSDAETGYYNAAYNLVFSTVILSNTINTSLYPSLTRQAVRDPESLGPIYTRSLRYLLALALPVSIGAMTLAPEVVAFLFGPEYGPAAAALQVVIWVVPLMFLSEFLGYVVLVAGREGKVARSVMVSTSLNIIFNLMLVPRFGLPAAATMTVITEAVLVGQYLWLLRSELRHMPWAQILGRPLAAAVLMGLLVSSLRWLPVPITVVLGVSSYCVLCIAFKVVGADEWSFIRSLRRPLPAQ